MKTIVSISVVIILSFSPSLFGQSSDFTWASRHGDSYIKEPQDQGIPGPCHIFAAVAGVEAIAQIYYNRFISQSPILDLSEAHLSFDNCGLGCTSGASDVYNALTWFINMGVINEDSLKYPITAPFCRSDCYTGYDKLVKIPCFDSPTIQDDSALMDAIFNYGPIILTLPGTLNSRYASYYMHGVANDAPHSVLIVGWQSNPFKWHVKDSWPGHNDIDYFDIDFFDFNPTFYRVYPVDPQNSSNKINCVGSQCNNFFTMSAPVDGDNDGWYNWGFDNMKPSTWAGIGLMDFNDGNPNIAFMYDNVVYNTPTISGPSYVCSAGSTFTLTNIPQNLQNSVSWVVTPSGSCSPSSGNGCNPYFTPASYIGRNCKITFTLTYNGTKTFEKSFVINGPREDLVSISVLDSYGGTPPNYGGTYYICPNTTYNITFNNYDSGCSTSDFEWILPYGWSEHWSYNNTVSIYTNDYPYGMLDIKAKTSCCSPSTRILLYTQYFSDAECEEDLLLYPNPSKDFVYIDLNRNKVNMVELSPDLEFTVIVIDRSGTTKYSSRFKGLPYKLDTSILLKGIYFINLNYGDKKSTIRLVVEH
jgi:hypothetical protein